MTITPQPITRDNWREVLELTVDPEQQRFVADYQPVALVGLAKAYVRPGGRLWLPFGFNDGERMVGFVELAIDVEDPVEVGIYHFFIDKRFQGQGTGTAALQALLGYVSVEFRGCRRIYLTVHPENISAHRFYQSAGFQPTGILADGEPVYSLTLS